MIRIVNTIEDACICDNFLTSLIQYETKFDSTIDKDFIVKDYFKYMINNDNLLYMYDDGIPKGYIFAKRETNGYLIDGLFVLENYRGNGIASKLLDTVINKLDSYRVFINVYKEDNISYNLYLKYNFKVYDEDNLKYYMELVKDEKRNS